MKVKENENILDTFFRFRQEDLMEEMEQDRACLKKLLKQTQITKLEETIGQLPNQYDTIKKELYKKVDNLIGDYEIKLAYYSKKYYKQGFNDAILLQQECKQEDKK